MAKELTRIETYEGRLCERPVKTLQLAYLADGGWQTAPFKEETGKLTYEITYKPPSQDATFEPSSIELDGITLRPLIVGVSQYFTAIAFEASVPASGGGRVLKLTFPTKPESNRIALASKSGEIISALDTSLDGRVFGGTQRVGVVAFEPFAEGQDRFDILFEVPPKKRSDDSETIRIAVSHPSMASDMAVCLSQPSILEQMTDRLKQTQKEAHERVTAQVKKASSGCLLCLALLIFAAGVIATSWMKAVS